MSIPLRLAVSEYVPTILPLTGQAQSRRSSSALSGIVCRAASAAVSGFVSLRAAGAGVAVVSAGATASVDGAVLASVNSRTACGEYGSFSAFGDDFTLSPARATTVGGDGVAGFASTTGGAPRSGAVATPL